MDSELDFELNVFLSSSQILDPKVAHLAVELTHSREVLSGKQNAENRRNFNGRSKIGQVWG